MARNIEFKAAISVPQQVAATADQLAPEGSRVENQIDTYFHCVTGRLKLREIDNPPSAQLIAYERADQQAEKLSRYQLTSIPNGGELKSLLASSLGVRGVVTKHRRIWLVGPTRIHLDQVADLGDFMEIEVVLAENQPLAEGEAIARQMRDAFSISDEDLIAHSYSDLAFGES